MTPFFMSFVLTICVSECVCVCVCVRALTASHMYAALQHVSGHYTQISYSTQFHLAT